MLTDKEKRFVNKLKRYFENEDEYNYKSMVYRAIEDSDFEKVIHNMTVDRIAGGSALAKYNRQKHFVYKPKPMEDDE